MRLHNNRDEMEFWLTFWLIMLKMKQIKSHI